MLGLAISNAVQRSREISSRERLSPPSAPLRRAADGGDHLVGEYFLPFVSSISNSNFGGLSLWALCVLYLVSQDLSPLKT